MSTVFKFVERAGEHTVFAPRSWDRQVGKVIPIRLPDGSSRRGELLAAKVSADGSEVELTVSVSDEPWTDTLALPTDPPMINERRSSRGPRLG